jgi:hypothetical protein
MSLATALSDRYRMAREMVRECKAYYDQISSTILGSLKRQWEKEIKSAETERFENPSAMDILGAREMQSAPNDPMPDETRQPEYGTNWLHLALLIEEQQ